MAIDIINTAKEVANAVKKYNDVPLMNQVFELQAALLDLQKQNMELRRELEETRAKLAVKDAIRKRGEYFFKDGEEEPLCPKCWQQDGKPVYLSAQKSSQFYNKYRHCIVCTQTFVEEPRPQRGPRQFGGPSSAWG